MTYRRLRLVGWIIFIAGVIFFFASGSRVVEIGGRRYPLFLVAYVVVGLGALTTCAARIWEHFARMRNKSV